MIRLVRRARLELIRLAFSIHRSPLRPLNGHRLQTTSTVLRRFHFDEVPSLLSSQTSRTRDPPPSHATWPKFRVPGPVRVEHDDVPGRRRRSACRPRSADPAPPAPAGRTPKAVAVDSCVIPPPKKKQKTTTTKKEMFSLTRRRFH